MFAVIKTGGKQYRVAADNVITVEKVAGEPGDIVAFGEVLMLGGESPVVGSPTIAGASVAGEVPQPLRTRLCRLRQCQRPRRPSHAWLDTPG